MYHGLTFPFMTLVVQKQPVPRHTVYLADPESEDAGKKGRVPPCDSQSTTDGSAEQTPVMDSKTQRWPIPAKHKEEFDSIKFDFMACPLGVYRETAFVEPGDVNDALQGAIVEMFFSIRHYYLRDKKFDTFQADMQQIKIIKPGASIASSGFKRRNARDGPLDVMAMGGRKINNVGGRRRK
ncbi:hypothetical protein M405DRAFT_586448 [Rhizopogon salebrosus TDB-379]|nr:hypothetical protein M405DRAFT_586448 [Rhizopogon salebrosus TDB-379]